MSFSHSQAYELTPQTIFPPGAGPKPGSVHEAYVAQRLQEVGTWGTRPLAQWVRHHAASRGDKIAYTDGTLTLTWTQLDDLVDRYAALLCDMGFKRGDRVGVVYPDGPIVHALYLATERAGLIAVGIGARAGVAEVQHILHLTGASGWISSPTHAGRQTGDIN